MPSASQKRALPRTLPSVFSAPAKARYAANITAILRKLYKLLIINELQAHLIALHQFGANPGRLPASVQFSSPRRVTGASTRASAGDRKIKLSGRRRKHTLTRSGQCRPLGARSLPTNPTKEKINGQGSIKKQPRKEKTETDEGKADGGRITVFRLAAEAGECFFISQETIARFPRSFHWFR